MSHIQWFTPNDDKDVSPFSLKKIWSFLSYTYSVIEETSCINKCKYVAQQSHVIDGPCLSALSNFVYVNVLQICLACCVLCYQKGSSSGHFLIPVPHYNYLTLLAELPISSHGKVLRDYTQIKVQRTCHKSKVDVSSQNVLPNLVLAQKTS